MAENYDFLRSFKFDDKETSHLFQIAKVNIPFLSKDNDFFTVGNTDGKHFRNTRLGDYEISIDGFIISDNSGMTVSETRDELVKIINSDEPKRLTLDLFPDRYFNAIFTGTVDYDATDTKYTPFTITFDVPDTLAHQLDSQGFTNVKSTSNNKLYDSNFNHIQFYYKDWCKLGFDKYATVSNTMLIDFTTGMPEEVLEGNYKTYNESWIFRDSRNQIPVNLNVGDSFDFMASVKVQFLPENTTLNRAGRLVVFEWGVNPTRKLATHIVDIPLETTNDFVKYTKTATIQNANTKYLSMNFAVSGDTPSVLFTQPMLEINGGSKFVYVETAINNSTNAIKVSNTGTYKTYPLMTVNMLSDNSLVAFVNEKKNVLQFGVPSDTDYIAKTKVETVKHWDFYGKVEPEGLVTNSGFTSSYQNYLGDPNTPNFFDGALTMLADPDVITPVFTDTPDEVWHGPSMVIPIPTNSVNDRTLPFTANVRTVFRYEQIKALGRIEVNVMDVNHDYVAGFVLRDSLASTDDIVAEFIYQGKIYKSQTLDRKKFGAQGREINIERRENQIIFRLCSFKGINKNDNAIVTNEYKFVINETNTQQIAYFGTWFMQWGNRPKVYMALSDAKVRWIDTPYIQDVKNVFTRGDVVSVDVEQRKLYINGVENGKLNTLGNEWEEFKLPLGDTYIQPVFSDYATTPEVNIEVHNAYL